MGDVLIGMAKWLGDNPEVLIFLTGLVIGIFIGKR